MEFDASDFGIAFAARTKSACGATEASIIGVFRMSFGGGVQTIAMEGAPADPAGTTYDALDDRPSLDEVGFVTFRSEPPELPRSPRLFLCDPWPARLRKPCRSPSKERPTTRQGARRLQRSRARRAGELVFAAKYGRLRHLRPARRRPNRHGAAEGGSPRQPERALQCGLLPSMSPGGKVVFIDSVQPLPKGSRYVGVFLVE